MLALTLARPIRTTLAARPSRTYSTNASHKSLYSDIIPAMIPIVLFGSAVYLGLQLTQAKLSHEKYMEEANARVKLLEDDIASLQAIRATVVPPNEKPARSCRWW